MRYWQSKIHRGVSLALIAILLVTMIPTFTTFAQGTTTTVSVDGLLVYEQPDPASRLIAVMSLGSAITTFPNEVQNGFTRVQLPDGRSGWAQLTVAGAPEGAPASGGGGTTTEGPTGVIVQAQANVRIRSEPSLNGTRLGNIPWGETADLLAKDASGDWYKINYKGVVGWAASAWFVIVSGNVAAVGQEGGGVPVTSVPGGTLVEAQGNIRIRAEPSLNGERIAFAPWGAVASLLGYDSTGDWININYNGLVGWSAAEWWLIVSGQVPTVARGAGGSVFTGGYGDLILFNGPDPNAVAIQVVPNGTPFTILEGGRPDGFTHIQLPDGKTGFVKLPETTVPVVSGQGGQVVSVPVTVTSATGVVVMAVGNIRVRNEPSINGERLTGLAWGDQVAALAKSADGEWLLIQAPDGIIGWAATVWFQLVTGSITSLPVQQ